MRILKPALLGIASSVVSFAAFAQQGSGPVQTPTAGGAPGAPGWLNFALIGGMIFFMWLFIIRPQSKRQKEHRQFVDSLKAGQEVVTQSGMIGKITSVSDNIVNIDFGSGPVRVLKSCVASELGRAGATDAVLAGGKP